MPALRRPAVLSDRPPRVAMLLCALLLGAFAVPAAVHAQPGGGHEHHGGHAAPQAKSHHPDAHPGVTGASVLRGEVVRERARDAYTIAARIPSVLDALFCHCDCHEVRGRRSLLECFQDDMAENCGICQGQARLAAQLHAQGKSLKDIRTAIDARYGG